MNSEHIHVSVVIPNYNCLPYLEACFASIQQQNFPNLEVIFVDDGSTDGSREYLQKLASEHPNIRLILESNVGPGTARNIAVQIAKGDFIAFLDADDTWSAEKLNAQYVYMRENPETTLTFTNYQHVSEHDGNTIIPCFDFWPEFLKEINRTGQTTSYRRLTKATAALFKENVVGTSTVMCRRDAFILVNGFDTDLPSASDWDLWLKLSKVGEVAFTTEIQMYYLVRANSVSRNLSRRIEAMRSITGRHLNDAKAQSANVMKFVKERLMDADCEYFETSKPYFIRVGKHLQTFVCYPTLRRLKALAKSLLSTRKIA